MYDPFGFHNHINSMMRGFMTDPFADMIGQSNNNNRRNNNNNNGRNNQVASRDPFFSSMSPFERHTQMMMRPTDPFSMMNSMMANFGQMNNMNRIFDQDNLVSTDPNSQIFSSSSVVTYSNSGDGQPKVFQQSKQIRHGPGGVKETREMVRDSTKGLEKVAIGHHIGDKAHVIERQRVGPNGPIEEIVNLENLDEGIWFKNNCKKHLISYKTKKLNLN
jgi:hypothetical protein